MPQVCITSNLQISRGCQWILFKENIGRNATFMPLMGECLDLRNCSDTLRYHLNSTSNKVQTFKAHHRFPPRTSWHIMAPHQSDVPSMLPQGHLWGQKNWCFMKMRIGSQETHPRRSSAQFPRSRSHRAYKNEQVFDPSRTTLVAASKVHFPTGFPEPGFFQSLETNIDKAMTQTPFTTFNKYAGAVATTGSAYNTGRRSVATKLRSWLGPCSRSSCYSTICQNSSGLSNHSCWCSSPELHVGMNLINMWGMKEQV